MNLIYLERQLRAGKTPEQLGGKPIGSGVCKTAYLFGNIVVKANLQAGYRGLAQKLPPKSIRRYAARTYKAGAYILQEYVQTFNDIGMSNIPDEAYQAFLEIQKFGLDTHAGNCGVNAQGQLVVFDW